MPYNTDAMSRRTRVEPQTALEHFPPVDERLVMPGSDAEILEGRVLIVPGADPPHAERHYDIAYLLAAHAAPGFRGALDMLTRTSLTSDFAPDASIYPEGPDPETGGRRLEVLAFEVVSEQRLSIPTKKARQLSRRGVRRIFALVLKRNRALEWDVAAPGAPSGRWRPMHPDETIEDVCLASPLPVRALLDGARLDETVIAALHARRPDLTLDIAEKAEARGEARGEARREATAMRAAIRELASALGIEVTDARERTLRDADGEVLAKIFRALARQKRWPARR
jgi:hypothetical protein